MSTAGSRSTYRNWYNYRGYKRSGPVGQGPRDYGPRNRYPYPRAGYPYRGHYHGHHDHYYPHWGVSVHLGYPYFGFYYGYPYYRYPYSGFYWRTRYWGFYWGWGYPYRYDYYPYYGWPYYYPWWPAVTVRYASPVYYYSGYYYPYAYPYTPYDSKAGGYDSYADRDADPGDPEVDRINEMIEGEQFEQAALALFAQGEYDLAAEFFKKAIYKEADAASIELRLHLGIAYFAAGDMEMAEFALRSGLRMGLPEAPMDIRGLYGDPGEYDAQFEVLEAVAIAPDGDRSSRFVYAFLSHQAGDGVRAGPALEDLMRLDPEDQVSRMLLETIPR